MPSLLSALPSTSTRTTGLDLTETVSPIRAVGIIVPAHNEEQFLAAALGSLQAACDLLDPRICVSVAVVLDGCTDRSGDIAEDFAGVLGGRPSSRHVAIIETGPGNVGEARAAGCSRVLDSFCGMDTREVWLATTDADTRVPPWWMVHQLRRRARGVEAWAGTVEVADWSSRSPRLRSAFVRDYEHGQHADRHVHGANLAFAATAYEAAGGFPPLPTGEDHGLWQALSASGATMLHDKHCAVLTSARRTARAPLGFAHALDRIERGANEDMPSEVVRRSRGVRCLECRR